MKCKKCNGECNKIYTEWLDDGPLTYYECLDCKYYFSMDGK